ncbi:Hypothetical protein NTJ_00818 [Nesidiocoris tenuis]|uniref:Uncharacterized protein n=1 Tax=Nesidiocoris tenuis TaxID=355587 RepID=A0ABN7A6X8_9HEMI|nr:Hypothetical protein NTJ_00818 [Nesidiocoris tenuis]
MFIRADVFASRILSKKTDYFQFSELNKTRVKEAEIGKGASSGRRGPQTRLSGLKFHLSKANWSGMEAGRVGDEGRPGDRKPLATAARTRSTKSQMLRQISPFIKRTQDCAIGEKK